MATTPRLALRYPSGTDSAALDTWTNNLALDIEAVLTERIQTGTLSAVGNGTTSRAITVNFPTAFASAPNVVVAILGDQEFLAAVGDVTTTSFQVKVTNRTATAFSSTESVRWVATNI